MAAEVAVPYPSSAHSAGLVEQTLAVARRAVVRTVRQRALLIFPMIFPLLFVTVFLSSSSLPRNLIKTAWFRDVATYNPISYLLEALRSLVITGWDARALALGFGFTLALLVIAVALSQRAMQTRLARK